MGDRRPSRERLFVGLLLVLVGGLGCKTGPEVPQGVPERWDAPPPLRPLADWIQAEGDPETLPERPPSDYGEAIFRTIRGHYPQFQGCYRSELKRIPELYGELVVSFEIDGAGKVRHPQVEFSSLQGPGIEPCVLEVFDGLQLLVPPKEGFKVRYPLVFTSSATPEEIVQVLKKRYRLETTSEENAGKRQKDDYDAPW